MTKRDPIVEAVRADLLKRSQLGIEKYGLTLDRRDLSLRDWLQHAYEETLDQANYLKRAIIDLDTGEPADARQQTQALIWAIAEIEGRTRYDSEQHFDNALEKAKEALKAAMEAGR